MNDEKIWDLERSFWLDGVEVYETHLHDQAIMVFPGIGILDRTAIIESLQGTPRWLGVQMDNRRRIATESAIILAYAAQAHRNGADLYRALCLSTYVLQSEGWQMISHQQTLN